MNTNIIFGSISMVVSLTASSLMGQPAIPESQKLTIPITQDLSFERGGYKIVKSNVSPNTKLSDAELTLILKEVGFSGYGLKMAKAIVFHESTNRPMALNKSSECYGLFQINMSGSLGSNRREKYGLESNEDLFNPTINASIAYKMSNGGKNWSAWSTEKSAKASIN